MELTNLVGDEEEDEAFLFVSLLLITKDSGFGVCIVIEELTKGEDENPGEPEDGEAKSKDLAKEVVNFSVPKLAHLGFQHHPTTTPKKNTTHIGLNNKLIVEHKPQISGFSTIQEKEKGKKDSKT